MALQFEGIPPEAGWTIQKAEDLLRSLPGVLSVRVVARPGGQIDEIHLLTTEEVTPKQTVRNVESALRARFNLRVDHRKISVARTAETSRKEPETVAPVLVERFRPPPGGRILFRRHQVETERAHRVKAEVALDWDGDEYRGSARGADLPRARLETLAQATLRAIEAALEAAAEEGVHEEPREVTLALDGVKTVDAFDRRFVLVAVNAIHDRAVATLSGAAPVEDSPDLAVILATLQATDRWVRGRLQPPPKRL